MLHQVEYLYDLTEEVCGGWVAEQQSALDVQTETSTSAKLRPFGRRACAAVEERAAQKQIVADYQDALIAHPDPIADAARLPHPKNAIKAALLAELGEANSLEATRSLTDHFLSLAKWLLLTEDDLAVLEARRSALSAGDAPDGCELGQNSDFARLANRVSANTLVLGAEIEHGPLRF